MDPVFRSGDLVVIHPHLPPRRDDAVILYSADRALAQLKEFVGSTETHWRLRRYHPKAEEFEVLRSEWPTMHLVYSRFMRR